MFKARRCFSTAETGRRGSLFGIWRPRASEFKPFKRQLTAKSVNKS